MRCCHCGKRIPETKEICPYCGHLQLEIEIKESNRRRVTRTLLVVLFSLLLAGGIVFFLQYKPTPAQSPVPTVDPLAGYLVSVTPRPTAAPTTEPTTEPTEEPMAEPTEEPMAEQRAEADVENTTEPAEEIAAASIEPTPEPTPEPTEKPHPGEHDLVGYQKSLVHPKSESWLSEYETVYVHAGDGIAIYLLNSPTNYNFIYGLAFDGVPHTALASENDSTLIRTNDGRIGWVKTFLLSRETEWDHGPEGTLDTQDTAEMIARSEVSSQPAEPSVQPAPVPASPESQTEQSSVVSAAQEASKSAGNAVISAIDKAFSRVSDALEVSYVADIGRAVFHKTDCGKISEISDVNRWECTKTRDELLRLGYEPCSVCNP